MNLAYQRRVAARLLKCGLDRVWVDDRTEIQERIGQLRTIRDAMEEDAYLSVMEELLVELALKAREIRALEGGGS